MKVSKKPYYALKAISVVRRSSKPVKAEVISEVTGIPYHFLSQILAKLTRAKILRSHKGKGGGFSVSTNLDELYLDRVFDAVDEEVGVRAEDAEDEVAQGLTKVMRHAVFTTPVTKIMGI